MRFDDSLKTVLAADSSTAFGAQATFRQLADLMARRRVPADDITLARLRELRDQVPAEIRATVARSLAGGRTPAGLVGLFAEDEPEIASAALAGADLPAEDWVALMPRLGPSGRAILRRRGDLDAIVTRALEAFGSTDFSIGYDAPPPVDCPPAPPVGRSPFTAVGTLTDALPVVAAARLAARMPPELPTRPVRASTPLSSPIVPKAPATELAREAIGFEIAAVVDRIATFQRDRVSATPAALPAIDSFRFETGADGVIRWSDAAPRGAIVGTMLGRPSEDAMTQVDGIVSGAFRRRTGFSDARLMIRGESPLAGEWRISGVPAFDAVSGRFTGYRGGARRPRVDETAVRRTTVGRSEGLRRLVHELRTPTNAISGFSELIEAQLLGPVAPAYRERASAIRTLAADLVAAIEDLDLAARIEGDALELRPGVVPVAPLLARIARELQALAGLRGCTIAVTASEMQLALACDDRAVERLLSRLLATIVSSSQADEAITVTACRDEGRVAIAMTRPIALAGMPEAILLNLDAEQEAVLPGAPLLGTGFALRLIRNLAGELGGALAIGADRLTVMLPAASLADMGQASTN